MYIVGSLGLGERKPGLLQLSKRKRNGVREQNQSCCFQLPVWTEGSSGQNRTGVGGAAEWGGAGVGGVVGWAKTPRVCLFSYSPPPWITGPAGLVTHGHIFMAQLTHDSSPFSPVCSSISWWLVLETRVSQCSPVSLDFVIQTRLDLNSQTYLSEIFILLGLKLCTTTADPESVSHKTKTNVSVVLFISFSQPQVQS